MADVFETFVPIDWEKLSVPELFGKEMNRICQAIVDNGGNIDDLINTILGGMSVSKIATMSTLETTQRIPFIQKGTFTPYVYWANSGSTYRSSGAGQYVKIGPLQISFFQISASSSQITGAANTIRMSGFPYSATLSNGSSMQYIGGKVFLATIASSIGTTGYAYDLLQYSGNSYAYLVAPPADIASQQIGYVRAATTASDTLTGITKVSGYTIALK